MTEEQWSDDSLENRSSNGRQAWIFHASGARFAGGVFEDVAIAAAWIRKHKLSGTLTAYPLNEGCFDWAVREDKTGMKAETLEKKRDEPLFIGGFTSACQDHFHFEDGESIRSIPDAP